jgi:hypothetical protein
MHRKPSARLALLAVIGVVALTCAPAALAGKPAPRYSGSLTATPNVLHAGDSFDVSGCGYDPADGNVIVGFVGGSWGSPLDSNGCFTIKGIPALSGDSLPAGTYDVSAYQSIGKRWAETGATTVTVVQ